MPRSPRTSPTKAELLRREYQAVTAKNAPRGQALDLLREFIRLYEREGFLPGGVPARLCDCCPNGKSCWAGRTRPKRDGENGAVMLPWIGNQYEPSRNVAVLAVNPNIDRRDVTDVFMECGISWEHHDRSLSANRRCDQGSWFAYRAYRSAAALQDAIDGQPVRDREPHELVETLHATARLQSVKCVPRDHSSKPTYAMWRNCPPLLLLKELEILRPAGLLVLGAPAADAIAGLDGFRWIRGGGALGRGCLEGPDWTTEVAFVLHPAARRGQDQSHAALLRSLRARRR